MSKTILRKSRHEINVIVEAGQIVAETLKSLIAAIEPGISTLELDKMAEDRIRKAGAVPTFKGYYGFPATICASVNEEVVHGIPRADRILKDGDIISIDCGATYKGLIGDSAVTVGVGNISDELQALLEATERSLRAAIAKMLPGNHLEDISGAIEDVGLACRYGIVKNYGGHGVGKSLHEEPFLPNFRTGNPGPELKPGTVLAIEPMFNLGTEEVVTAGDNWTVVTKDGLPSAHFEHTVIVTEDRPIVATERKP